MVNPTDYFLYVPLLPEVAAGRLEPRRIAVSVPERLPDVRLILGEVARSSWPMRQTIWTSGRRGPVRRGRRRLYRHGGGRAGVLYTDVLYSRHPRLGGQRPRWLVLDVAGRVLPELDERLSRAADRVLRERAVLQPLTLPSGAGSSRLGARRSLGPGGAVPRPRGEAWEACPTEGSGYEYRNVHAHRR